MISHQPRTSRLRLAHRAVFAVLVLGALLAWPTATWAHPLGNFTVNRYSRIELGGEVIRLRYIVDMAEIPAFQEQAAIDRDRDGTISASEREEYIGQQLPALRDGLQLLIDGQPVTLEPASQQLEFPEGQGGLKTLRLTLDFDAALPGSGAQPLSAAYQDSNYVSRLGWQEIVVHGTGLIESSAPDEDRSDELRNYPQDMLQSPLAISSARFRFTSGAVPCAGAACTLPAIQQTTVRDAQSFDRFAQLIATPVLTPQTVLLALLLAFGLGAAHALTPGHGKTIVAAYLVGTRGTARHALFLGLTTTITHTAGVFGLGLITLLVSEFILPEQLYPWLGVISGALVFGIGVTLFRGRLRSFFLSAERSSLSAERLHQHSHDHDHSHAHAHDHDHDHSHTPHHDHSHAQHPNHAHAHAHGLLHDHGDGHVHSHLPPGADGSAITWRSLLALGVSGGLLPCPSALVVLLGAIALGRVGFGLLLIVAFSLGLASVLTAIGVLLVYAGRIFEHLPTRGPILRALPIASALLIAVAGVGITVQALLQTGIIRL